MTKQEALELLNKFEFCCAFDECTNDWGCEECGEALKMAIKALAAELSKRCCDKAPKNYDVDKSPYQKKNCIMQCLRGEEK